MTSGDARAAALRTIKLGLAVGLVIYIVTAVPVGSLIGHLRSLAPGWFALAFLLYFLSHVIGAGILHLLLRQQAVTLSVAGVLRVSMAAQFYALFVPAGTLVGGAIRWYRLGASTNKFPEVLTALVTNRVLEILGVAGVAGVGWLIDPTALPGAPVVAAVVALFAGAAAVYTLLSSRRLARRAAALVRRARMGERFWRPSALRLLSAVRHHGSLTARRHAELVILSLLRHATGAAAIYALAAGLRLDLTLIAAVVARSIAAVLMMLPISFAGLGVRDAAFVVLLAPYGIEPAGALALSLSAFALAVLLAAIGGACEAGHLWSASPPAPAPALEPRR